MRVVMVCDDGQQIDRRILLEAQTIAEIGHEVIVIARNDRGIGDVVDAFGTVKIIWIDLGLNYLGGLNEETELSALEARVERMQMRSAGSSNVETAGSVSRLGRLIRKLRVTAARHFVVSRSAYGHSWSSAKAGARAYR